MPNLPNDLLSDDPPARSTEPVHSPGRRRRGILLVIGVAVLLVIFGVRSMTASAPNDLGVTNGRLSPLPSSPNGVSSEAARESQKLAPFPLKSTPEETLDAIEEVCKHHGGEVVTREGDYLHVIFRTALMRYTDDVEWLVAGDALHFRSKSRVGYWDLGVNRRRVERLRRDYTSR